MGTADEAVEVGFERAGGGVGTNGGQVGRCLAVEQAEIAEIGLGKAFDAAGFRLIDEQIEAVPVSLTKINPEIGNHEPL